MSFFCFWSSSDALWKITWASSGRLGSFRKSKSLFVFFFSKIICCANAGFRCFETLDGLLGSILAPLRPILGPIWPQEVAQNQYGNCSKACVRQQETLEPTKKLCVLVVHPKASWEDLGSLRMPWPSQEATRPRRTPLYSREGPRLPGRA